MADLEQYLIARVLPSAYDARPGRPQPRFSEQQARQALAFLARQMDQDHTRDLAWWQIPRWAPTGPRMLASMLASGLLGAIVGGLGFVLDVVVEVVAHGVMQSLWTGFWYALVQGLAFGLGVGLSLGVWFGRGGREPKQVKTWRAISVSSVLTAGLVYGLVGVLLSELISILPIVLVAHVTISYLLVRLVGQLVGGFIVGFLLTPSGWHGEGQGTPHLVKIRRRSRVFGLVWGLVAGIDAWYLYRLRLPVALLVALAVALVVGLVVGLMPWLAGKFVAGLAVEVADGGGSPQGPIESWRNDRVFGRRVGLLLGVGVGLGYGLNWWYGSKDPTALPGNLFAGGLPVAVMYGMTSSATWPTTLAWRQLRRSGQVPAVGLMPFLEDARNRDVLRTVGAVYQFRHATLQDQLAGQTTAGPATSSATEHPS